MRVALALVLAMGPAAAQLSAAQGTPRVPAAALDKRVDLDLQSLYDDLELSAALHALAAAYPEFLSLESLGTSRGGRELWLVTVAGDGPVEPAERSALLAVGARGSADAHGAEMVLFTLFELAQNHARDPDVARTLAEKTLYFLPCLDPDRRAILLADKGTPAACEPDRNLPTDWSPWGGRGGPYPLSEPESRAALKFLEQHPNVAVVQTYGARPVRAERRAARLPTEDLALYDAVLTSVDSQVDESGHLSAFCDLAPVDGSLLGYACLELGAFGFECEVAGREPVGLPQPYELYLLARRAYQITLSLAEALPRLAWESTQVARLKNDQWQVDVAVSNTGLLPTASGQARRRSVVSGPRLVAKGVKLIAVAQRTAGDSALRPLAVLDGSSLLSDVPGGGRIDLSLFVGASAETQMEASLRAARAGTAAATIVLR